MLSFENFLLLWGEFEHVLTELIKQGLHRSGMDEAKRLDRQEMINLVRAAIVNASSARKRQARMIGLHAHRGQDDFCLIWLERRTVLRGTEHTKELLIGLTATSVPRIPSELATPSRMVRKKYECSDLRVDAKGQT